MKCGNVHDRNVHGYFKVLIEIVALSSHVIIPESWFSVPRVHTTFVEGREQGVSKHDVGGAKFRAMRWEVVFVGYIEGGEGVCVS